MRAIVHHKGVVVAVVAFALLLGAAALAVGPLSDGQKEAGAAGGESLSEAHVVELAASAARAYFSDTIGGRHQNADGTTTGAATVDGQALAFDDMDLVDLRFASRAREMATSPTTKITLEAEYDLWSVVWERPGVFNVASGEQDGTAYLVVVLEDVTGKVVGMNAGIRQPE